MVYALVRSGGPGISLAFKNGYGYNVVNLVDHVLGDVEALEKWKMKLESKRFKFSIDKKRNAYIKVNYSKLKILKSNNSK